jgi:hypothetical protein
VAAHGFDALAELDQPQQGGNGDGVIDHRELGYHDLKLWLDLNLNGISEEGELVSLAESRVWSIALSYVTSPRQDRFGNRLTYWSRVALVRRGRLSPSWAVDVFFQHPIP